MSLPVAFCYSVEKLCVKWNSSAHHLRCCSSYRTNRRSGHQSIHQTKDRLLSNLKSFSASANGSIFRFINPAFSPKERDVRVASWSGLFGYRWRQRLQQGSHLLHPRPTVVPPCRTWAGEVPASPFPWSSCSCAQCGAMAMVEPIAYKFWALWIWMQLKWAAWVCLLIWEPRIRLFSLEEATFFIAMWASQRLQSSCPHRKGETPMFHDSCSHAIPVAYDW